VQGDRIRLTQALANLLSNAAKYTAPGGHISITGRIESQQIELSIRDNGMGIRAAELPLIFDLFTQAAGTGDPTLRGLGIGLALVRRLVEMHAGSITAHSEGPGKGSEFVLRLPLLGEGARPVAPPAGEATPAASAPRRVLVADDNADVLKSLTLLLEERGHFVYTARDGQQTLERAERCLPEVVLLDIGMPLLDGYEVARRIRAQPWGRAMRLVAITGWGQESDRGRSRAAGFDAHLVKPVDLGSLTEALAGGGPHGEAATA